MKILRTYKFRIYPTPSQQAKLEAWSGCLRFLWNLCLEQRFSALSRLKENRKYYSSFEQQKELTNLRVEYTWINDVPRAVQTFLLENVDKTFKKMFDKTGGKPKFKKKGRSFTSISTINAENFKIDQKNKIFQFANLGERLLKSNRGKPGKIKAVYHQTILGTPKKATITKDVDQWFVCISCEQDIPQPTPSSQPPVGIDFGVVNIISDSTGKTIPNPRFLKQESLRLIRAQRSVARKLNNSKNQNKAKDKVAKLHRKIRRRREHFIHNLSKHYANNHSTIVLEDLKIKNMTASAKGTVANPGKNVKQKSGLNKAILDSGWGLFKVQLEYKSEAFGSEVTFVNAHYSSQECSKCSHIHKDNRKSQSNFTCIECGHSENADINAAKNILRRKFPSYTVAETATVLSVEDLSVIVDSDKE